MPLYLRLYLRGKLISGVYLVTLGIIVLAIRTVKLDGLQEKYLCCSSLVGKVGLGILTFFAAKKRPRNVHQVIYRAPLFNVFDDGRTCAGTHRFPVDIDKIPESFFTSER